MGVGARRSELIAQFVSRAALFFCNAFMPPWAARLLHREPASVYPARFA